jgi:hypothetical protein
MIVGAMLSNSLAETSLAASQRFSVVFTYREGLAKQKATVRYLDEGWPLDDFARNYDIGVLRVACRCPARDCRR